MFISFRVFITQHATRLQSLIRFIRRPEVALLAACAALWGWTYGLWDLAGADEGRYVQVAKELLGRSNWLLMTVNGEPYDQKPPLPFWIFAGMLWLVGGTVTPWAVRLPSVLAGVASLFCVHSIARKRFGERAGWIAAILYLTSPLVIKQTPTARLDMLFTGWITAALWVWLTREEEKDRLGAGRTLAFWVAVAGAFFTKGPLTFVIVFSAPLWESLRLRSWKPWRALRPALGLAALAALIAGWLVAQGMAAGKGFVLGQIWGETYERIAQGSHKNPFWYYAKCMLGGVFMPWALLLPSAVRHVWRDRKAARALSSPIWAWAIIPLVFLHFGAGKRHQYLLPMVPAFAIVAAVYLDRRLWDRPLRRWIARVFSGLLAFAALLAWAITIAAREYESQLWDKQIYVFKIQMVMFAILGLALALLAVAAAKARKAGRIVLVVAGAIFAASIVLLGGIEPALSPRDSTRLLSNVLEGMLQRGENSVGGIRDAAEPKFHVYGGYRVIPLTLKAGDSVGADWPRLVVAEEKDARKRAEQLKTGGYERVYGLTVNDDPIAIYHRPGAAEAPSPDRLRFALLGDTGTGSFHQHGIAKEIAKIDDTQNLDGVFLLGDNIYGYDPYPLSFQRRIIEPFEPLIRRHIPLYAALGNHDYGRDYIHQLESPLLHMNGKPYYSVKFGDLAAFFIVSSEVIHREPVQIEWLRGEVANSRARWKILILHEPLDASNVSHGANERIYRLLEGIITDPDGIDLVFAGHNHIYERREPRDGVTHITLGAGAKVANEIVLPSDPKRIVGYNATCTFGWIDVQNSELKLEVVDEFGKHIDSATFQPRRSRP